MVSLQVVGISLLTESESYVKLLNSEALHCRRASLTPKWCQTIRLTLIIDRQECLSYGCPCFFIYAGGRGRPPAIGG